MHHHYVPMHTYPKGTRIQRPSRYIFLKQDNKVWKSEHRWMMEQKVLGRDLEPGERVFHRNGVKDDNNIDNLVVIKYSTVKFVPLKKSAILFIPGIFTMSQIRHRARKLARAA